MPDIHFFPEKTDFTLPNPQKTKHWLINSVSALKKSLSEINYIFTSDNNLLNINVLYLNHDYFTDIITFDNSECDEELEGDIYISIDRVRENAKTYNESFDQELLRVMIHGILHLAGYNDKTDKEKKVMRKLENHYLALRNRDDSKGVNCKK